MTPLLAEGGHIVISVPHAGRNAVLLASDFAYQPWGLLDKTHIHSFGMHNIQVLCDRVGLKITEVSYVIEPRENSEFARRWRQRPKATRQALEANPLSFVYQVVAKAVPKFSAGKELKLASIQIARSSGLARDTHSNWLTHFLLTYQTLHTRKRIARLQASIGLSR